MAASSPHSPSPVRLRTRILLLCAVSVLITSSVFSVAVYHFASGNMTSMARENALKITQQVDYYFDVKLRTLVSRVFAMFYNKTYTDALVNYLSVNQTQYFAQVSSLFNDWAAELEYSDDLIDSVYVYTPKGSFYKNSNILDHSFIFEGSVLCPAGQDFRNGQIYQPGLMNDPVFAGHSQVIPLVFCFTVSGYRGNLYVVVNLDVSAILDYFRHINMEDMALLILDGHGQLLAASQELPAFTQAAIQGNTQSGQWYSQNSRFWYLGQNNILDWQVGIELSASSLLRQLRNLMLFCILLAFLIAAVCIGIAVILAGNIARPLSILQTRMEDYEPSVPSPPLPAVTWKTYEAAHLAQSFEHMSSRIEALIQELNQTIQALRDEQAELEVQQRLKRQAELQVLQSQINPHFLYNTLNIITWMAEKHHAEDIQEITTDLGNFFHYSLNDGREILTFEDEFRQVESYLRIQKCRYGDMLDYELILPEAYAHFRTLKLLVQPLVENAIQHGIREMENGGHIRVELRAEALDETTLEPTAWILTVEDDGSGMSETVIGQINEILSAGTSAPGVGYGMFNVNQRIRLFAGTAYGLHYRSVSPHGVHARLRLPVIPDASEEVEACIH